jgi:hypothetical protein
MLTITIAAFFVGGIVGLLTGGWCGAAKAADAYAQGLSDGKRQMTRWNLHVVGHGDPKEEES